MGKTDSPTMTVTEVWEYWTIKTTQQQTNWITDWITYSVTMYCTETASSGQFSRSDHPEYWGGTTWLDDTRIHYAEYKEILDAKNKTGTYGPFGRYERQAITWKPAIYSSPKNKPRKLSSSTDYN